MKKTWESIVPPRAPPTMAAVFVFFFGTERLEPMMTVPAGRTVVYATAVVLGDSPANVILLVARSV